MGLADIHVKDAVPITPCLPSADAFSRGILVPVNSSQSAFNALEYTLNLAKVLPTTIHLLYVANIDDLTESNNPVVVNRMLDRLYRKASNCVTSLKEMIEESGVKVITAESRVGKAESIIHNLSKTITPDMIVIGRGTFEHHVVSQLITTSCCPVMCIPESITPHLPASIILSHQERIPLKSLDPFCTIIKRTSQNLTVLHPEKHKVKEVQNFFANVSESIEISCQPCEELDVVKYADAHEVDLVCVVHRSKTFLERIFKRDKNLSLVHELNIPVMVIGNKKNTSFW